MITVAAVGDGVADDTVAIQTALSAGGHIYLPGGTYSVPGAPLRIKERTRLELAPDARILRAGAAGLLRNRWPDDGFGAYSGRGDLLIEGGVWDMAGGKPGVTTSSASAISLAHAENVVIRDTTILNVPGWHGLDLLGLRNVRVEGVRFLGFRDDPDDGQMREAIQIDGTFASYSGDCAPFDSTPCDGVMIRDCWFAASDELPAPQRAVGSHGYIADVTGHEHSHITITGCTMTGCTDRAVYAWCWVESSIHDNTIISPTENGVAIRERCWHLDVTHNRIYGAGTSGIWCNGGGNNLVIHGNTIIGAGRRENDEHYGIGVEANCSVVDITGNRVRRRSSGNGAKYGLYISGSCSQILHHTNDLRSSGVTGSRLDNSPSPVTSAVDAL